MEFTPGFFSKLFGENKNWTLSLSSDHVAIQKNKISSVNVDYLEIRSINIHKNIIWNDIHIEADNEQIKLSGINDDEVRRLETELKQRIEDVVLIQIINNQSGSEKIAHLIEGFINQDKYIANYDRRLFLNDLAKSKDSEIREIQKLILHPFFNEEKIDKKVIQESKKAIYSLQNIQNIVSEKNEEFINNELIRNSEYFDSIESTPLSDEQRVSSVAMEDRNLLIASAGSGKTSSIIGKLGYALKNGLAEPEQILVLAFADAASKELKERVNLRLGKIIPDNKIQIKTFHSFGKQVIAEVENRSPSVPAYVANRMGSLPNKALLDIVYSLISSDGDFVNQWILLNSVYFYPAKDPVEFKTIKEWDEYVQVTGNYVDGENGYVTYNGECVKSQGELAIANWCFINNIKYEYEKEYQYDTATKDYRQYYPDFYFPDIDCYLEHYALDSDGKPPPAFGEKYLASIEWKRQLHEDNKTNIFETYFSEFVSGEIFEKIKAELESRGLKFRPRPAKEILDTINTNNEIAQNYLYKLIWTFIKHAKSNQFSESEVLNRAESSREPARAKLFTSIIYKILEKYEERLNKEKGIDFEDMINKAAMYIEEMKYMHSYKLIMVDEFQDISSARARLIKSLLKQKEYCKLFAVGDDWQSIYRFTGAELSLFTKFSENFGATDTRFLTKTYRSNQGIANVAAEFIQKNKDQIKKTVHATNTKKDEVIKICKYENKDQERLAISDCLEDIVNGHNETKPSVYILGRYNFSQPEAYEKILRKYGSKINISYKTFHSSKGLQADYVIIVDLHNGKYGMPSQIVDDPLLNLVLCDPETYPHSEERRLFYVALTRAINRVYLVANKYKQSIFLTELESTMPREEITYFGSVHKKTIKDAYHDCPYCKTGSMLMRYGINGKFLGCSNFPNCDYTENV